MAISTSPSDERVKGRQGPVARLQFNQMTWSGNSDHAAQTEDLYVNGTIVRMDIIINSVTGNPTTTFTFADENSVAFGDELNQATLTDGTNHYFDSRSSKNDDADFNPVTHCGTITVTADPSAAAGVGQTLTVDVILYLE